MLFLTEQIIQCYFCPNRSCNKIYYMIDRPISQLIYIYKYVYNESDILISIGGRYLNQLRINFYYFRIKIFSELFK